MASAPAWATAAAGAGTWEVMDSLVGFSDAGVEPTGRASAGRLPGSGVDHGSSTGRRRRATAKAIAPAPTTPSPIHTHLPPLDVFCAVRFSMSLPAFLSALRACFTAFLSPVRRPTASSKPFEV